MKTVEVPDDKFLEEMVPPSMINALRTLRDALRIYPGGVSHLLNRHSYLTDEQAKSIEEHPHLIASADGDGDLSLSAFGLLAACINTERLRLAYDFDDDKGRIHRFYIVRVELDPKETT